MVYVDHDRLRLSRIRVLHCDFKTVAPILIDCVPIRPRGLPVWWTISVFGRDRIARRNQDAALLSLVEQPLNLINGLGLLFALLWTER